MRRCRRSPEAVANTLPVLAVALRINLETLLQAMLEGKLCTREEVRDFVKELERDALQYDEG